MTLNRLCGLAIYSSVQGNQSIGVQLFITVPHDHSISVVLVICYISKDNSVENNKNFHLFPGGIKNSATSSEDSLTVSYKTSCSHNKTQQSRFCCSFKGVENVSTLNPGNACLQKLCL